MTCAARVPVTRNSTRSRALARQARRVSRNLRDSGFAWAWPKPRTRLELMTAGACGQAGSAALGLEAPVLGARGMGEIRRPVRRLLARRRVRSRRGPRARRRREQSVARAWLPASDPAARRRWIRFVARSRRRSRRRRPLEGASRADNRPRWISAISTIPPIEQAHEAAGGSLCRCAGG